MAEVVIVGGGHNGLVCATYLAKHKLKVTLLEKRALLGGACVTEELWPGFRNSRASYVCGLFRPIVMHDLKLKLPLIARHPSSYTPVDARGGGLLLGMGKAQDMASIAQFSKRDAQSYGEFERIVSRLASLIDPLLDVDAANLNDSATIRAYLKTFWGVASSGRSDARGMAGMILGSARNQLTSYFESEVVRSTLATDALIGTFAGPSTPGTGYVLVHHMMGGGSWSYVQGGMGTITSALEAKARENGVDIVMDAEVTSIDVDSQRVILDNGREIGFRKCCVSNMGPTATLGLLPASSKSGSEDIARYIQAINGIDYSSPVMKINLALDSAPVFHPDFVENKKRLSGTIHLGAASLDELDESYRSAARGDLPRRPMIELTVPSALDDSLAPPGKHVCSLFVQHVPPKADAAFWTSRKESFVDACLRVIEEASPGFKSKVLHRESLSPVDLERIFGLQGGNIFHGAMTLDRMLFGRPVPAHNHKLSSGYATPWKALFLCGAGTHPGGGVMGACGRNAAMAVLKSLRSL